jgi:hypothetical protein
MLDSRQWIRTTRVVVGKQLTGNLNSGLSIDKLRIKYTVEKSLRGPPNTANILIYNLAEAHVGLIKNEYDDVVIDSGHVGNSRIVFRGSIKYPFHYRDTNDWITEIQAADGDKDYNAIVNTTLVAGKSADDAIDQILAAMPDTRRGAIHVNPYRYLRGRVLAGPARSVLDTIARENGAAWSIQDGSLDIIMADAALPSEAVVVNADTGMIGAPEVSGKGIRVRMLLNPQVRVNGLIILDNNNIKIQALQQYSAGPKVRDKQLARLDPDGRYKVYKLKHECDTRSDGSTDVECVAFGQPGGGR